MKKRITSLLAMLLVFVLGASAQCLPELDGKSLTPGVALDEFQPNTWYFLLSTSDGTNGYDPNDHPLPGDGVGQGGFVCDTGLGKNVEKHRLQDIGDIDNAPAAVAAKYIVRFLPVEGKDDAYIMQFGTGRYAAPHAGAGNGVAALYASDNIFDAEEFNIYTIVYIDEDGNEEVLAGHFGFCEYYMGKCLNNNGQDKHVCWWQSGEQHDNNSNSHWALFTVELGEIDDFDVAMAELDEALAIYGEYYDSFEVGTLPGKYGEAEVEAFYAVVDACYELENPESTATAEDVRALIEQLKATYEAVLASRVVYTIPEGYYFIASARDWTNQIQIEPEEEGGETRIEYINPTKGIFADNGYLSWKTLDEDDCTFLWKIAPAEDGNFVMQSMANDMYIGATGDGVHVPFVEEMTTMTVKIHATSDEGESVFAIIPSGQNGTNDYLHAAGHSNGNGVSGNIVGWREDEGGGWCVNSEWKVIAVPEDVALQLIEDYAPIKNHEVMVEQWLSMRNDAAEKLELAKDIHVNLGDALITDAEQLSSPYSDSQEGTGDSHGLQVLIDGKTDTFWHSDWHGQAGPGVHYLQVWMPEDIEVETAAFKFTRRKSGNDDHIVEWKVLGTNDFDAETEDCAVLAESIVTPLGSNTETLTSSVFPTGGYAYLRFCFTKTAGSTYGYRTFAHMAEFQLYPAEVTQNDPNQYAVMGDIVTNLEAVMAEQADIDTETLDIDQYNAMKAAYEAFIAKYVDPAPLRDKVKEVTPMLEWIKVGDNPGEWKDDSSFAALKQAIDAASAYDKAADFTPAQSEEHIAKLDELAGNLLTSANQIRTDKWYTFQMGSEEVYTEHPSWDAGNLTENEKNEGLFSKYMTVATYSSYNDSYVIEQEDASTYAVNSYVFFDADEDIPNKDLAKWRFIAVGDTAYIIQNKATGLFLKSPTGANSEFVRLNAHPSLVKVDAAGYGFNLLPVSDLLGGRKSYLHAAKSNNILCTWPSNTVGTNSAMLIAEAGDVEADYDGTALPINMVKNTLNSYCFPVAVSSTSADAVLYTAALEDTKVTLYPMEGNKVDAGQPFILVYGSPALYEEPAEGDEEEVDVVRLKHGFDVVAEPGKNGALLGTYDALKVGTGKVVDNGLGFEVTKKSDTTLAANSAYLDPEGAITDLTTVITLEYSEKPLDPNAIESVVNSVVKVGTIYTLDGRMVGKGNLNAVKNLGRGIYILNGVKISVK